jgi:hypothetical protein
MCNLQVEELEPRQLLNGTGFSPQAPARASGAGTCPAQVARRPPFVEVGGSPGPSRAEAAPAPSVVPSPVGSGGPEAPGPRPSALLNPGAGAPASQGGGAVRAGAGPEAAAVPESAASNPEPVSPPEPQPANSGPTAEAAAPPEQPARAPAPPLQDAVAAVVLRAGLLSLSAVRLPLDAYRESGGAAPVPEPVPRAVPAPPARPAPPAAGDGGEAGQGPAVPAPAFAGVLTALPPGDLSALELGVQQFLHQLEHLGQRLADPEHGTDLWPWVVAAVAAGAAGAIARRQWRRPATESAPELNPIPGSPPGSFPAG